VDRMVAGLQELTYVRWMRDCTPKPMNKCDEHAWHETLAAMGGRLPGSANKHHSTHAGELRVGDLPRGDVPHFGSGHRQGKHIGFSGSARHLLEDTP